MDKYPADEKIKKDWQGCQAGLIGSKRRIKRRSWMTYDHARSEADLSRLYDQHRQATWLEALMHSRLPKRK
jgi:hypothetical protein